MTTATIAAATGVTKQRVSQIVDLTARRLWRAGVHYDRAIACREPDVHRQRGGGERELCRTCGADMALAMQAARGIVATGREDGRE